MTGPVDWTQPLVWLESVIPAHIEDRTVKVAVATGVGVLDVDSDHPGALSHAERVLRNMAANLVDAAHATGGNTWLNTCAFTAGGFAAYGLLERDYAYAVLHDAAWFRGQPTYGHFASSFDSTFMSGWSAGLLAPIPLPESVLTTDAEVTVPDTPMDPLIGDVSAPPSLLANGQWDCPVTVGLDGIPRTDSGEWQYLNNIWVRIPPPKKPIKQWYMREWNDVGNGDRFHDHFGEVTRYMSDLLDWAVVKNGTWVWDGRAMVRGYCRDVYLAVPTTEALLYSDEPEYDASGNVVGPSPRDIFLSWWFKQSSEKNLTAMEHSASRHHTEFSAQNQFDTHDNMLNCADGVLMLPTPEAPVTKFGPHDARLLFTRQTNARGNPRLNAKCENWDLLMKTQFPDDYERFWVEVLFAYAGLRNSNYLKLIIFLLGVRNSGKTQVSNGLKYALGTYAGSFETTMLRGKVQAGPRPDIVRAILQRLVINSEIDSVNAPLHANHIKRLTGDDIVSARNLWKNFYLERIPCFTPLISLNTMPIIEGADEAMLDRTIAIPFVVVTERAERIRDMPQRLRAEADGILARLVWALEHEHVLAEIPARFQVATSQAFADASLEQRFMDSMTVKETGAVMGNSEIKWAYLGFCEQENIQPQGQLTMTQLGMRLSALGWAHSDNAVWCQTTARTERVRYGRRLRTPADDAAEYLKNQPPTQP